MRWNLDALYTSFDAPEFQSDLGCLTRTIDDYLAWVDSVFSASGATGDPAANLLSYVRFQESLDNVASRLFTFASLVKATDTKNAEAQKYTDRLQQDLLRTKKADVRVQSWIGSIPDLSALVSGDKSLREFAFFFGEIADRVRYQLSEQEEAVIARMVNTGSRAWSNLQGLVSSNLLVDIEMDGKPQQLPLPVVRNLAHNGDPAVRRRAFDAEMAAYPRIEDISAACINSIKGEVLAMVEMRGYDSALDMTLRNSRMEKATLDAMLGAIRESLPTFRKYLCRKAEMLGHKNGLPIFDLFAPMGKSDRKITWEEACTMVTDNFRTFGDSLADYARNAIDNQWIDSEPRTGKRGGAFCSSIHPIGQSRVLMNFTGTPRDVATLAHELGHGFHGYCQRQNSILNASYPMPVAETASTFCETIIAHALLKNADHDEKLTLIEARISDQTQVIVDIYSRFLFESELFEKRREGSLSVDELKDAMVRAQLAAYGDGLDPQFTHPYMWLNKPHYYSAGANFYNYPYAFGQLFAIGLYARYLKQGPAFVPAYESLLKATGSMSIRDVALMADIDVNNPAFWQDSLKVIAGEIEMFLNL